MNLGEKMLHLLRLKELGRKKIKMLIINML